MNLIAQLTEEHHDYVLKLTALAETIEGIRVNGRGDLFIETLDGLLKALTTELDAHAQREEDYLFPKLVERAPESPIPVMLEEHETIRAASQGFDQYYRMWKEGEDEAFNIWARHATNLRGTFSTHMQKENLIVFPLAKRVLTPDEIERLLPD